MSNAVTIALNGGTLPASAVALHRAGILQAPDQFANSGVLQHPRLAWLGDAFAVPAAACAGTVACSEQQLVRRQHAPEGDHWITDLLLPQATIVLKVLTSGKTIQIDGLGLSRT